MIRIGRLVGRAAAAAGGIGAAAAITLAPQPGLANHLAIDEHSGDAGVRTAEPAPSAACVAAVNAFKAALKADVTEDTSERALAKTGANTNDPAEDATEKATLAPLRTAVASACGAKEAAQEPRTAPSATCTSAKTALKTFLTSFRAEEMSEATNGEEGTTADRTEDAASFAQLKTLWQATATACGSGARETQTFRSDSEHHSR